MLLRMLGPCPGCKKVDVITFRSFRENTNAYCKVCRKHWPNWASIDSEIGKLKHEGKLVAAGLWYGKYFVRLETSGQIPMESELFRMILDITAQRFELTHDEEFDTLDGKMWKSDVHLRGSRDQFGLAAEGEGKKSVGNIEVLRWFKELLKTIFFEDLGEGGTSALLRTAYNGRVVGSGASTENEVMIVLARAVQRLHTKPFWYRTGRFAAMINEDIPLRRSA